MPSADWNLLNRAFRFKENVPLKTFIQEMTSRAEESFTLAEILETIKNYISAGRLFDENNPSIIICSDILETVFNKKALHVLQVKSIVLSQLIPEPIPAASGHHVEKTATTTTTTTTTSVTPTDTMDGSNYELKTPLRRVFQTMDEFDQRKTVFTYSEITKLLSNYIIKNQNRLFDLRNIKVAIVEDDLLGAAFQVRAFHRSQVHTLLRKQLKPHPNPAHPTWTTITSDSSEDFIGTMRFTYLNIQDVEEEDD